MKKRIFLALIFAANTLYIEAGETYPYGIPWTMTVGQEYVINSEFQENLAQSSDPSVLEVSPSGSVEKTITVTAKKPGNAKFSYREFFPNTPRLHPRENTRTITVVAAPTKNTQPSKQKIHRNK